MFALDTNNLYETVLRCKLYLSPSSCINMCIVKPVYNDHPWDPKTVAVVDRWLLFRGNLCDKSRIWTLQWWPLWTGGRYSEVVVN